MPKTSKIKVQGTEIRLLSRSKEDYVCITDIARSGRGNPNDLIKAYLRNRSNIEFLGLWEQLHNESFKTVNFNRIRTETGLNNFVLSVKEWITNTDAIGIEAKAGRYGGTYAHKDIAIQFATWLSPTFYLYLIKEFQRLQEIVQNPQSLEWNVKRVLAKANYRIHTDAVRTYLIPPKLQQSKKEGIVFANEADLLNVALFGMTAKTWRKKNPSLKGNMRDYASAEQLLVLANLESLNAKLLEWGCELDERLSILNKTAIGQIQTLLDSASQPLWLDDLDKIK